VAGVKIRPSLLARRVSWRSSHSRRCSQTRWLSLIVIWLSQAHLPAWLLGLERTAAKGVCSASRPLWSLASM